MTLRRLAVLAAGLSAEAAIWPLLDAWAEANRAEHPEAPATREGYARSNADRWLKKHPPKEV